MDALVNAIDEAGYSGKIKLAIDSAANSFVERKATMSKKYYFYHIEDRSKKLKFPVSTEDLLDYYVDLTKTYPLFSIEDPFDEFDWRGFREITKKIGDRVQIVGDDLVVTNPEFINQAAEENAMNGVIVKINQIGTVMLATSAAFTARKHNINLIVSHRSGETTDTFISDFSFAIQSEYIKTGAPARGERTAKYNQLLRIEEYVNNLLGSKI